VILGERNSGVPWLKTQLQGLYPNITVTTTLIREGFWFQSSPLPTSVTRTPIPATMIVAVFRNPYDWVEQMRLRPRFMPAHLDAHGHALPWNSFVQRQWSTQRPPSDYQEPLPEGETCQLGFSYDQVVSCRVMDPTNDRRNPIYELQQGGVPYLNILALRAAKIQHIFQEIPHLFKDSLVVDPVFIPYETNNLADELVRLRVLEHELDSSYVATQAPIPDRTNMTAAYVDWMTANVNWKAEARLGYKPQNGGNAP
jgi:hypothetical protein